MHLGDLSSRLIVTLFIGWLCATVDMAQADPRAPEVDSTEYERHVVPFISDHCLRCHGAEMPKGELSLETLRADMTDGDTGKTWRDVARRVRLGEMPPADQPRPDDNSIIRTLNWINAELDRVRRLRGRTAGFQMPSYGNLVDHDSLFKFPSGDVISTSPRIWRLSPEIYEGFVRDVTLDRRPKSLNQPFTAIPGNVFKDYAAVYTIDEPTTQLLMLNADAIVDQQSKGSVNFEGFEIVNKAVEEFFPLLDPGNTPNEHQIRVALQKQFQLALRREPSTEELARFTKLMKDNVELGGQEMGVKATLATILLLPEAVFRMELADGKVLSRESQQQATRAGSRRMLSPRELAHAVSYALCDHRESGLFVAATRNGLTNRQQVAQHVNRILNDSAIDKPRILRFFREYFGYHRAIDVFKDKHANYHHVPESLVRDTDMLVQYILDQDENVLAELLTTNRCFVNFDRDRETNRPMQGHVLWIHLSYNLPEDWQWTDQQPVALPKSQRAGILTQPSWLISYSGNFDNDLIRRGLWIRERLLGGHVPEVPINVDARLPDDKDKTLRQRMAVTRDERCWKCHQSMDPLGLPLEQFDHFGRFRTSDGEQPVVTSGTISGSGEVSLDGDVRGPIEMLHRLAKSEHVQQVFIRHAFRYFMGRNENIGDAQSLQDANRVYIDSGGSFKALVASLLTSDSFLYRYVDPNQPMTYHHPPN